jgi:hypothetical protein
VSKVPVYAWLQCVGGGVPGKIANCFSTTCDCKRGMCCKDRFCPTDRERERERERETDRERERERETDRQTEREGERERERGRERERERETQAWTLLRSELS